MSILWLDTCDPARFSKDHFTSPPESVAACFSATAPAFDQGFPRAFQLIDQEWNVPLLF